MSFCLGSTGPRYLFVNELAPQEAKEIWSSGPSNSPKALQGQLELLYQAFASPAAVLVCGHAVFIRRPAALRFLAPAKHNPDPVLVLQLFYVLLASKNHSCLEHCGHRFASGNCRAAQQIFFLSARKIRTLCIACLHALVYASSISGLHYCRLQPDKRGRSLSARSCIEVSAASAMLPLQIYCMGRDEPILEEICMREHFNGLASSATLCHPASAP